MQVDRLGPYRIGKLLGRGGMGAVYAGQDEDGNPAAIKVLSTGLGRDVGFRERFEAEIETLRKLKHPNIVRLFGYGEENGVLFYAMELVDGRSLEDDLRAGRKFRWEEAVRLGVKLCGALRHAHDRGVVHRDIKPANLLLTTDDDIKLSDFGIAKLFGATGMTSAGGILGTAEYMAPEQADGRPVGHRADLYSLGAVLYTLIAGRPPFVGKSIPELLHMQRYATPEPLRKFSAEVPEEIETIILQLLEKDPERRIANAVLVARRLEATSRGLEWKKNQEKLRKEQRTGSDTDFEVAGKPNLTGPGRRSDVTEVVGRPSAPDVDQFGVTQATGIGPVEPDLDPGLDVTIAGTATPAARESSSHALRPAYTLKPLEDQATGADVTMAAPGTGYEAAAPAAAVAETTSTTSRFTTVPEHEEHDPLISEEEYPLVSPQTVMLAGSLLTIGLLIWYMLQPPSADDLYGKIKESVQATGDPLSAATDISRFLELYPSDPRSREMEGYLEENEVLRLERRFAIRANRLSRVEGLKPIEADYLEAMSTASVDPALAYERLKAIAALYGDNAMPGTDTVLLQKLIQRQLMRLRGAASVYIRNHLDLVRTRLADANRIAADQPLQAAAIYSSVVELYAHKPWAQAEVAQARTALAELESLAAHHHRQAEPDTAAADDEAPAFDPRDTPASVAAEGGN